jgi:hypothetical protein
MSRQQIECELVRLAVEPTPNPEGQFVTLQSLEEQTRGRVSGVEQGDIQNALKRLFGKKIIGLRYWDRHFGRHDDYKNDSDYDGIFFGGTFFIRSTEYSKQFLERCEPHVEPPKRRIGFQA